MFNYKCLIIIRLTGEVLISTYTGMLQIRKKPKELQTKENEESKMQNVNRDKAFYIDW